LGGHVVVVRNNRYEPVEDSGGAPFSLREFIGVFLKGYPAVLVFDINGIEQGTAQFEAISDLGSAGPEVWWDPGARDHLDAMHVITAGADRAALSTRSLDDISELAKAMELTENVTLEIVARGGQVVSERRTIRTLSPAQLAKRAADEGVEHMVLLDADRPLGGAVDWNEAAAVGRHARSLFVAGGVSLEQAKALGPDKAPNLKGAVVDLISVLSPYL
jgi:phosphoribosylformimino-5-aminoimidazole carboxamide ribonucleotide (ProFAR) isomerase